MSTIHMASSISGNTQMSTYCDTSSYTHHQPSFDPIQGPPHSIYNSPNDERINYGGLSFQGVYGGAALPYHTSMLLQYMHHNKKFPKLQVSRWMNTRRTVISRGMGISLMS